MNICSKLVISGVCGFGFFYCLVMFVFMRIEKRRVFGSIILFSIWFWLC